jgi:biopolymer transport protein ExbD
MRNLKTRNDDATFELNLAPMLDIIVSIVPMLLMSVAFVHITVVDTPVPQVVEKAVAAANEKSKETVQILLAVSKETGFHFTITDKGQSQEKIIALKGSGFDLDGLYQEIVSLKKTYPDVFRLELNPEENVPLNEIVGVMDQVRTTKKGDPKVVFTDTQTGKPVETNLLFPDVVFGNVTGG